MFISRRYEIERAQKLLGGLPTLGEEHEGITLADYIPPFCNRLMHQADIDVEGQRRIVLRALLYSVAACTFLLLEQYGASLASTILGFAAEYVLVKRKIHTRAVHFERDYPTFLLSLASSIRTGLDTLQAIASVSEMFPESSELRKELTKLIRTLESGTSEQEAFLTFGSSIAHPDIRLFSAALLLSRKQGSSLGTCLQRLTKVTRQRQTFRRKSRAAVAMQRMSAFGIAGCSVLIGGMQIGMNAKSFVDSWHHPLGFKLIVSGISLLVIGLVWMLRLGRTRI